MAQNTSGDQPVSYSLRNGVCLHRGKVAGVSNQHKNSYHYCVQILRMDVAVRLLSNMS